MRKIFKICGLKIFEILTDEEAKADELKNQKSEGFVLDDTPLELLKDKEREEEKKYEV